MLSCTIRRRVDSQFQYQFPRLAGTITAYTCKHLQVPMRGSDRPVVPLHAVHRLWVCDISDRQRHIDQFNSHTSDDTQPVLSKLATVKALIGSWIVFVLLGQTGLYARDSNKLTAMIRSSRFMEIFCDWEVR
jgi:hypothetical protein